MKKTGRNITLRNAFIFLVIIIGISFWIAGKIIYLQLTTSQEAKENVSIRTETITPKRGDIYSVDGKLLATSVCYYDTYLDLACQGVRAMTDSAFDAEIDSLSICLADLFKDKTKDKYKSEIGKWKKLGFDFFEIPQFLMIKE